MKKNNKKNNNQMINSRLKSLINPLYTFFVVAVPSLMIWIFFSNDFPFADSWNINYSWWIKLLISVSFIVGAFLITVLFIFLKILPISILNFSLPISICFMVIFVTDNIEPWIRALIIVPFLLLSFPITILVKKIDIKIKMKKNKKWKNEDKIIGHK